MRIVWSDRSIDRLLAIHDYIAEASSANAASLIQRIFDSVERLRMFPKSGRVAPDFEQEEIREVLVSSYRVLYRERTDRIEIVNVLHARQQP
jgi:plasmid stabilization system protein ParE